MLSAVDENVLVVANGRQTHASLACQLACVEFLLRCKNDRSLLLDAAGVVLALYASKCNFSGQPGTGDEFFLWAFNNAHGLAVLELVRDSSGTYLDVPDVLMEFDWDDHIWIALVRKSSGDAQVVNAVDSDYIESSMELEAALVGVLELCPGDVRQDRT